MTAPFQRLAVFWTLSVTAGLTALLIVSAMQAIS